MTGKDTVTPEEASEIVERTMGGAFTKPSLTQTAQGIIEALDKISTDSHGQWLCAYQGQNIYKTNGLYYVLETGCWETLIDARDSIDRWIERTQDDIADGDMDGAGENTF